MERQVADRVRLLLRELGRALQRGIADSPEAQSALDGLRQEGYSLHLLLERRAASGPASGDAAATPDGDRAKRYAGFRINSSDLFFLRSIGIDPTRRVRAAR
jgi:hypothetical protein